MYVSVLPSQYSKGIFLQFQSTSEAHLCFKSPVKHICTVLGVCLYCFKVIQRHISPVTIMSEMSTVSKHLKGMSSFKYDQGGYVCVSGASEVYCYSSKYSIKPKPLCAKLLISLTVMTLASWSHNHWGSRKYRSLRAWSSQ